MSQEDLFTATPSRINIVTLGVLGFVMAAFGLWCLTYGELSRTIEFVGAWLMLLGPPFAIIETALQRYEFGQGIVRFRKFLRWREEMIPHNLRLDLSIHKAISVRNADDDSLVVELTREFTRGGKLLEPLADFYRATGRVVQTNVD